MTIWLLAISNVLAWLCILVLWKHTRILLRGQLLLLQDKAERSREKYRKLNAEMQENFQKFVMDMDNAVRESLENAAEQLKKEKKKPSKKIKIDRE